MFSTKSGRQANARRHMIVLMVMGSAAAGVTALSAPPGMSAITEVPIEIGADLRAFALIPPPSLIPEAEFAVPTRLDSAGRVLAPVMINGQGPFRFILDTGANRAVLSPRLAKRLGLHPSDQTPLAVHGVTGSAVLPAVVVDSLQAGGVLLVRNKLMPVLSQDVLADADGILGIEGLSMARIDIDFVADTVHISPSNGRTRAPSGFLTIPASLKLGGLLMVHGKVGRVRVKAIIDTGAERTLGNTALRAALLKTQKRGTKETIRTVFGATPALGEGTSLIAPPIFLGEAELRDLEVTFGDLHVFTIWGLDDTPAILIGMDLLGIVQRIIVDYRRSELQVKPR